MIRLRGIDRCFQVGDQQVAALDQVDLDIARGDYCSIMGPSGSGKSTLLNVLGLLDRPDAGQYLLNDIDTCTLNEEQRALLRRDHIGFVFQAFHLIARLSAYQNVELPLTLAGIVPGERRLRVEAVLQRLGIEDRARHRPHQLSGGQRQRVAIARAIVMQPDLVLADEPTGNLDRHSGAEVVAALEQLHQDGMTLIVVTHDPEVGARAERRIRMVDGRIAEIRSSQGIEFHAQP
jgi:putative ABC transport system ATP-binding protein